MLEQLPAIRLQAETVSTLLSAGAYKQELLAQIARAENRIYLCSLYLQNDEAGAEILSALHAAKAARPMLDIVVLVDWHRAQRGLIGEAKQSGVLAGNAAWYQEFSRAHVTQVALYGVPVQTRELFGVLHLKGFVIDDTVIYSGASINNVYLHQGATYRHDRYWLIGNAVLANSMVNYIREYILSAAAVQRLDQGALPATKSMRSDIRAFRSYLKKARYNFNPEPQQAEQYLSVTPLSGVGRNNPLNRVICQLLAGSRQQITICTPYFNFPLAVRREINHALRRGVQIDIVIGDKRANDFYIPPEQAFKVIGALPYLYEMNLRRFCQLHQREISTSQLNLRLWKDGANTYHLKGLWVDQDYVMITGNNLNPRAFRLDLENALLIHDPRHELLEQNRAELASILQHTTVLGHYRDIESVQDYPAQVRQLLTRLNAVRLDRLAYRVL